MAAKSDGANSYAGKPKSKPKGSGGGYAWEDGRKVHSISMKTRDANRKAAAQAQAFQNSYGIGATTPLDAPLTAAQAYGMANAQAGRVYDPQIAAARSIQTAAPQWYQDYIGRVTAANAAQQAYAQPMLDNAKAGVTNAAAITPGLDPSSAQYATEQQAAQGRQSLAQLGYDTLAAVPAAASSYFGGLGTTAARELPQVLAQYGTQIGQLEGQRAQAASEAYGTIRSGEQNASIARATLGANIANQQADNALATTKLEQDASDKKAARSVSRRNTRDRIAAGQQKAADAEADKARKEREKKTAAIQKSTRKIKSQVSGAQDAWARYERMENPASKYDPDRGENVPDVDPRTGKQKTVKATPDQIRQQLRKDGYTEAEIKAAEILRSGRELTPADIQRLKDQDPNFRTPAEWRAKKKSTRSAHPNRPAAPKNDPSGYGDRPT